MRKLGVFVVLALLTALLLGQSFTLQAQNEAKRYLNDAAWSPDGARIVAVGSFGIQMLDENLRQQYVLRAQEDLLAGSLMAVSWSSDNNRFAVGYKDGSIRIWDAGLRAIITVLTGHTNSILSLDWGKQGLLATTSADKTVRVWNVETGQTLKNFVVPSPAYSVHWNAVGDEIAFGGGDVGAFTPEAVKFIQLWKIGDSDPHPLTNNIGLVTATLGVDWSPDGRFIAATPGELTIFDVQTGENLRGLPMVSGFSMVAWSPDGNRIAVSETGFNASFVIDANSGDIGYRLFGAWGSAQRLAWKPDSSHILSATSDGILRLWNASDGSWVASAITPAMTYARLNLITTGCVSDEESLQSLKMLVQQGQYQQFVQGVQNASRNGSLITAQCIAELPPSAQYVAANPEPTELPIPTSATRIVTWTPDVQKKLKLTSMCSANPSAVRVWRVRNDNTYPVNFTWDVYGTSQKGFISLQGVRDAYFQTVTIPNNPNTVRIFVNGKLEDTKASNPAQCTGTVTPFPSPTP